MERIPDNNNTNNNNNNNNNSDYSDDEDDEEVPDNVFPDDPLDDVAKEAEDELKRDLEQDITNPELYLKNRSTG